MNERLEFIDSLITIVNFLRPSPELFTVKLRQQQTFIFIAMAKGSGKTIQWEINCYLTGEICVIKMQDHESGKVSTKIVCD